MANHEEIPFQNISKEPEREKLLPKDSNGGAISSGVRPSAGSTSSRSSVKKNDRSRGILDDDWMPRVAVRLTRQKNGLFPEKRNQNTSEDKKEETEKKIDDALEMGEFHFIKAVVNPKSLIDCKTNVLLKTFEVNKKLIKLSEERGPEQEGFEKLADAVDEFATTLIDPLKSDDDTRNCYRNGLDYAVDRAIDLKQKKFIVHPVVDDLLRSKWHGSFLPLRNSKFTKSSRWIYFLLKFWALIDMFVFPFLFALFFFIHLIKGHSRKRKDIRICFVLALSEDAMTKDVASKDEKGGVLNLIEGTVDDVIRTYGYRPATYCIIQSSKEHIRIDTPTDNDNVPLENVDMKELDDKSSSLLHSCLDKARDAFTDPKRKASKKVLVVFVNDKIATTGPNGETASDDLKKELIKLGEEGVEVIPIGIGQYARLDELKDLRNFCKPASDKESSVEDEPPLFDHLIEEDEPQDKLVKTIVHGIEGKDIYERYLEYFTTPCFIFVRDTLSSLVLLGLLIYICLSPSYLAFSLLEWIIFVFLLGRIVMEIKQFAKISDTTGDEEKKKKEPMSCLVPRGSGRPVKSDTTDDEEKTKKVTWPKKIIYYFSDTWNLFDFFILITYVTTFTLRMISWGFSDSVADNRPLAVAGYLYGLVAMLLTLRTIGHLYEGVRGIGPITIAVYFILFDMFAIFCQFVAAILAFSLMITKVYVAERSYISVGNGTEELACSTAGLDCWFFVTKHLTWSVIGIAELEPLHSVDGFSLNLVHVLYSFFLIIGAILLVNMMIALLSNTYQRVENNSLKEWSFKKAVTIKSYCECHPFPIPFNLLYLLYELYMFMRCRCDETKYRAKLQKVTERKLGQTKALDKLVVELERIYFAAHGYTFPLTDETKVDQLLYETNGNHHMTNQIARRIFEQLTSGQDTGKDAWKSRGIEIEGCVLTCKAPDLCDVCEGIDSQRRHGARYNTPFTPKMPRLEVLIQESGESRILGIGAVYENYNLHWQPGWRYGTVGYTADDGGIREPNPDGIPTTREADEAMAYRGDLMACEVDFISKPTEPGTIPIKFFLNGREVATSKMVYTEGKTKLYPYIAMGCRGIRVLARLCPREEVSQRSQLGSIQAQLQSIDSKIENQTKEMEVQRNAEKELRKEMEKQRRKEMEELKSLLTQAIQMKK